MRRVQPTILALLAAALGWAHAAAAQLGPTAEPRLITVTGEADIKVVPDEVVLTLGVETSDKVLAMAKSQNDARIRQLLALTQKAGIDPQHVQTDQMNIEPRYRDGYEQRDFIAYFVRKNIVITLKDLSRYESLISEILESGVDYVHGIQFGTSELRKYRDQARLQAIRAAQDKAVSMASQLEQTVGKPYKIIEEQETAGGWATGQRMMLDAGGGGGPTIAPGQLIVTGRVTVSFELADRPIE